MAQKNNDTLLDETIKKIEKEFGKGSIMKLGERAHVDVVIRVVGL